MKYYNVGYLRKRFEKLYLSCMQAKIGKQKEFEAALRKLRGKDADVSAEADEIQVLHLKAHLFT